MNEDDDDKKQPKSKFIASKWEQVDPEELEKQGILCDKV